MQKTLQRKNGRKNMNLLGLGGGAQGCIQKSDGGWGFCASPPPQKKKINIEMSQ